MSTLNIQYHCHFISCNFILCHIIFIHIHSYEFISVHIMSVISFHIHHIQHVHPFTEGFPCFQWFQVKLPAPAAARPSCLSPAEIWQVGHAFSTVVGIKAVDHILRIIDAYWWLYQCNSMHKMNGNLDWVEDAIRFQSRISNTQMPIELEYVPDCWLF